MGVEGRGEGGSRGSCVWWWLEEWKSRIRCWLRASLEGDGETRRVHGDSMTTSSGCQGDFVMV